MEALLTNTLCIHTLRNTLHSDAPLLLHAAQRGVVDLLLRRGYLAAATTLAPADVLDALAILINLAVVAPEATLPAVPAMAELLQGGYGAPTAADAAWFLGNLAVSSAEARVRLRQAGCVRALWRARTMPNALWALGSLIADRPAADQLAHEEGCGDAIVSLVATTDEDAAWVATNLLAHGWLLRGLVEALLAVGGGAAVRGLGYAAASVQIGKRIRGLQAQALQMLIKEEPGVEVAWALANWCGVRRPGGELTIEREKIETALERALSVCIDNLDFVEWTRSMVSWYCNNLSS